MPLQNNQLAKNYQTYKPQPTTNEQWKNTQSFNTSSQQHILQFYKPNTDCYKSMMCILNFKQLPKYQTISLFEEDSLRTKQTQFSFFLMVYLHSLLQMQWPFIRYYYQIMNSKLFVLLLLAGITSVFLYSTSHQKHAMKFNEWTSVQGKKYESNEERLYREKVFNDNVAKIEEHNADETQTYKMGINQFTDLIEYEFAAQYLTLKVNKNTQRSVTVKTPEIVGDVDWVAAGKVSPVKDQKSCGSCWAFSAVGAIESAFLISGKTLLLSEQQLVDCSGTYGNYGCNGGWMDSAFQYVIDHGLNTQESYPYTARNGVCTVSSGQHRISAFVDTPGCDNLENSLNQQPISVAVDASNWSPYRSGVFANCAQAVNHGVLLVGSNSGFWTIKNSWGVGWGEKGYIRLAKGNTCAVCNYPSYPKL